MANKRVEAARQDMLEFPVRQRQRDGYRRLMNVLCKLRAARRAGTINNPEAARLKLRDLAARFRQEKRYGVTLIHVLGGPVLSFMPDGTPGWIGPESGGHAPPDQTVIQFPMEG